MDNTRSRGTLVLGAVLLAIGILSLLGQFLGGSAFWPYIIILLGLACFGGMVLAGRSMGALAIPGAIITGVGLMLLVQNTFNLWESWTYAWTLLISFVGIGMVVAGAWSGETTLRRRGWEVVEVGISLFIAFGMIFELIFGFIGQTPDRTGLVWPVLLIAAGIAQLIIRSWRIARGDLTQVDGKPRDVNLFWPVILIGAGLLWLLTRQGIIPSGQIALLINLWPILLVAGGINLLLGKRLQFVNLLLGVIVVAGMFFLVTNGQQLGLTPRLPWVVMSANIQRGEGINRWVNGSGVLKTETRPVTDFSRITFNGAGDMTIAQGAQASLTVEGEDNLLPYITTTVSGGELVISTQPGVGLRPAKTIHYRLTVKDLRSVTVSGSGTFDIAKFKTDQLDLTINGAGRFNLTGLDVKTLKAAVNGGGSIHADGQANRLSVEISGAGECAAPDLKTTAAVVQISGVGTATVWATETLESNISGLGSVSYYGSPSLSQTNGGLGSVRKLGDK